MNGSNDRRLEGRLTGAWRPGCSGAGTRTRGGGHKIWVGKSTRRLCEKMGMCGQGGWVSLCDEEVKHVAGEDLGGQRWMGLREGVCLPIPMSWSCSRLHWLKAAKTGTQTHTDTRLLSHSHPRQLSPATALPVTHGCHTWLSMSICALDSDCTHLLSHRDVSRHQLRPIPIAPG